MKEFKVGDIITPLRDKLTVQSSDLRFVVNAEILELYEDGKIAKIKILKLRDVNSVRIDSRSCIINTYLVNNYTTYITEGDQCKILNLDAFRLWKLINNENEYITLLLINKSKQNGKHN